MSTADIPATPVDSPTEERNPQTTAMDTVSTLQLLQLINDEDRLVPEAVARVLPELAALVEASAARMGDGGRVHYVGAGTSGRIGVVDAAELLPTFNLEPDRVVAHLAGGDEAIIRARENVEDDAEAGAAALAELGATDVVIGLAASGRTPFVAGALHTAGEHGALTALVTSNPRSKLLAEVDHPLVTDTGPEALTGSTRMKAATAEKLVLHSFSTALMVRLDRTWSNLMVSMVATNAKLRARTTTILTQATGLDREHCAQALQAAGGDLKIALVALLAEVPAHRAQTALSAGMGNVRTAVSALTQRDDNNRSPH